jgi:hypothetical protein
VSDDLRVPDSEPIGDQCVDVARQGGFVIAGRGAGAVAQPGEVDGVDGVLLEAEA